MVLLIVLSVSFAVWASGMVLAGFLMDRPEKPAHRCWWHRWGMWRLPRALRPASVGSPCWMLA